jgi:RNA polymerase sigma-70 factor (ECF subfamily)
MLKKTNPIGSLFRSTVSPLDIGDAELIARICAADEAALEILYKRYYPKLFRFSLRMTRRLDCVEEVINDVMYVVWKKSPSFRPDTRASTWIFGIAYNKCLKALEEKAQGEHLEWEDAEALLPGVCDSGLKNLEIEDWVAVAFGKLPADQRAVLELAYHQGLHYQEIAQIMDCPENTVKTRMFHARKKIKALYPDLLADLNADSLGTAL